jgi:hypothetical protein
MDTNFQKRGDHGGSDNTDAGVIHNGSAQSRLDHRDECCAESSIQL